MYRLYRTHTIVKPLSTPTSPRLMLIPWAIHTPAHPAVAGIGHCPAEISPLKHPGLPTSLWSLHWPLY